ncbi:unnamed protein product [Urochloa humidicola]
MEGPPRSWADLPLELAGLVLGRLPSHVDRLHFAAVCPQWHSAARQVRLPPPPPLLALKNGRTFYSMPMGKPLRVHFPNCDNGFPTFNREHSDFRTVSGNWLVYRQFSSLLLLDPFSGATMTLPAPSSVNYSSDVPSMQVYQFEVIKLIVCSSDLIAALFLNRSSNRIAVCRPGASLWSVAWDLSLSITDMAFYQGKLYAVNYGEELLALDISVDDNTGDPQVAQIGKVIEVNYFADLCFSNKFNDPMTFKRMLYLVESRGSLLLVRRRIFRSHVNGKGQIHTFSGQCEPEVAVFKADFVQSWWAKVATLGDDQALFLGPCSRAVCMPQHDSPGNRFWFLDDYKNFHPWGKDLKTSSSSDTSGMAYHHEPFSPFPMISWRGYLGRAGAAWLFPSK